MADVFLCQTGQLTAASRRELKRAGIVVVEVEDPGACQFIRATETISHDDMLWACINALNSQQGDKTLSADKQREQLAKNLWSIINAAHAARHGGSSA